MDGTITDSKEFYNRTLYPFFQRIRPDITYEEVVAAIGSSATATFRNFGIPEEQMVEFEKLFIEYYEGEAREEIRTIPIQSDTKHVLEKCHKKGYKTALLTNSMIPVAEAVIEFNDLTGLFDVCSANNYGDYRKELRVESMLKELGISKNETVCIGDSEYDF